ncbi:MAG: manganese efflux pump MntP family protein [Kofleriaceae bacterium]
MSFGSIVVLAIGLAMDATAVAAARGLATPRILFKHLALVALLFGGFQGIMPLIGWAIGDRFGSSVQDWDHWIAFGMLAAIGGKTLWDAQKPDDDAAETHRDPYALKVMLVLAVATSIDAFAVGVTLPMLNAPLVLALVTIAITTAVLSGCGLFAGQRFGHLLGRRLDVIGGLVLIGLGVKILIEHLTA